MKSFFDPYSDFNIFRTRNCKVFVINLANLYKKLYGTQKIFSTLARGLVLFSLIFFHAASFISHIHTFAKMFILYIKSVKFIDIK